MSHEVLRHHVLASFTLAAAGRMPPPGRDLLSGGAPCYAVYRTADGRHLAVGALELKFWQALCGAVGRPEWAERHWTRGLAVGSPASMALRAELAAVIAARPLADWVAVFERVDACVTPVLRLDETLRHPVFLHPTVSTDPQAPTL
jgi:alpha-methylacyl-CoA racemase